MDYRFMVWFLPVKRDCEPADGMPYGVVALGFGYEYREKNKAYRFAFPNGFLGF